MMKISILLLMSLTSIVFSNTGVFFGSGSQVIPIKNEDVQLVFERVQFDLSVENDTGMYGVPTIPWVFVNAEFHLQNIKNKKVELQMGFPFFDLQGFGDEKDVLENMNFKVSLNGVNKRFDIKEGMIEPNLDPDGLFKKVFTWNSKFNPHESKVLKVSYKMRMGISSLNVVRQFDEQGQQFREIDKIFPTIIYGFSYITRTAYTWAGKIDSAIFILNSGAFVKRVKSEKFITEICDKSYKFEKPIFLKYLYPPEILEHDHTYKWKFTEKVPEEGIHFGYNGVFLPLEKKDLIKYIRSIENNLEKSSIDDFLTILESYYSILINNQIPNDSLSKLYFENIPILEQEKTFMFSNDSIKITSLVKNIKNVKE